MNVIEKLIEETLQGFSQEFVRSPYLCYTEHGLHARFYFQLISTLPKDFLYIDIKNKKMCAVQKEYRTWNNLGRTKRQNWDIAIIDKTRVSLLEKTDYDYLPLISVTEFGLNEPCAHLTGDIDRLDHKDANISGKRFIAHFYRISDSFSRRDFSPRSKNMLTIAEIKVQLKRTKSKIDIYFGVSDTTRKNSMGLWVINKDKITPLITQNCERFE